MSNLDAWKESYRPEQWSKGSNSIVCDYTYSRCVNGGDLWTGPEQYVDGAYQIIQEPVVKSAFGLRGPAEHFSGKSDGS